MDYEVRFIQALLLTIAIETIVLIVWFKWINKEHNIKPQLLIFVGVFASFATLPYLWFILPKYIHVKLYYHLVSELTVVLIESIIIQVILKMKYSKALFVSFLCNASSYGFGLLVLWLKQM